MSDKLKEIGKTSRGYTIFVEEAEHGGNRYISDEIGGGVCVYDTMIDRESIILAMNHESTDEILTRRKEVTKYVYYLGDTRFVGKSIPVGIFEVKGYYRKPTNSTESSYVDRNGYIFIVVGDKGEVFMYPHELYDTRELANGAYYREAKEWVERYQKHIQAMANPIVGLSGV